MNDETKIVTQIEKNSREKVYIGLNQWKDQWYIFIRTYVPSSEEPDSWIPTKKGISVAVSTYPVLQEAIEQLGEDLVTEREAAVIGKSNYIFHFSLFVSHFSVTHTTPNTFGPTCAPKTGVID